METLLRTRSGQFGIEDSVTLSQVQEAAEKGCVSELVIGIEEILSEYPRILCTGEGDRLLFNGNPLSEDLIQGLAVQGKVRMCPSEGVFLGVYQWDAGRKKYLPVKMFL